MGDGFGEVLRALRESRSLTQEEVADRAGLTVKAVGALERGERRRPYPHTVRSLAAALALDDTETERLVGAVPARRTTAPADGATPVPEQSDDLVGRERELSDVLGLLERRRLVTLTGPGGVGKTTLARAVASALVRQGERVTAVDLADVRDPDLVLPRIAAALGLPETPTGTTVESLATALGGRRLVLLLDNLEQVLDGAPALARLVETSPDVKLLATSRAPLRVRAEHEVRLGPLDLPGTDAVGDVAVSPAARLLVDRMAAAGTQVGLDDRTAPLVAEVCRRLDGLPLAVELAAARSRVLGLDGLLGGNALSGNGLRDLPDRQRTIAAVVTWSHDLLDVEAQDLFAALSVFHSPFTLASVEALVDDDVLESLSVLVEQSLVVRLPSAVPRFRLLHPIREQAAARLTGPDGDALRDRHARLFEQVAADAGPALFDHRLLDTLARLDSEDADLRAAVAHLVATGRHGAVARTLGHVWLRLALRNHGVEGLETLARLDLDALDPADAAAGHRAAAGLRLLTGDLPRMHEHATAALALAPDGPAGIEARLLLANAEVFLGRPDAAQSHLDATAGVPGYLGAYRAMILAQVSISTGDVAAAVPLGQDAVERARAVGNDFLLMATLNVLAGALSLAGDAASSARLLAESVTRAARTAMAWPMTYSLPALAGLAVRLGRYELAARLFGASASLAARSAADRSFPVSREQADRDLAELRARLGGDAFRVAWDVGRAAGPEDLEGWADEILGTV
ncbi:helix-turn-helix domain-containing protein [Kineosporia sp. A_224]|uniref:ATP-binding protein n=1 Tax=Kineosporia sp. A_224 TaxID=1962180 RepID=UPI000B4AA64F|nr:helix-turn-helix domain-containing protein [Kineosporia sp. A_224]